MDHAAELAASADDLACLIESLQHEKHASSLRPLNARLKRMFARRFRTQQKALLSESEGWLRRMATAHQEADAAARARMQAAVTAQIRAGTALTEDWPEKDSAAYGSAITAASRAAAGRMTLDYSIDLAKEAGNVFAEAYLREHAFSKLASGIDRTTVEHMANAVADVYEGGGSYNDAVGAIKDSFAEMSKDRADLIARTELADAYNSAMLESAKESRDLLKTWEPDGEACEEICIPNVEQGPLPLDEDFLSGDDAPPGHPRCDCSLGFLKAE